MFLKVKTVFIIIIILVLGLFGQIILPSSVPAQRDPVRIIKADKMTREQFQALPEDQVIEFKGKKATKREILARMRQMEELGKKASLKANEATIKAQAKFKEYHAQFLKREKTKLDAENAKVKAELARLKKAWLRDTIQEEAAQLFSRYKTASPIEKRQIDKRADELLHQLQQL